MWETTLSGRKFNKELDLYECTKCKELKSKGSFTYSANAVKTGGVVSNCKLCISTAYAPKKSIFINGIEYLYRFNRDSLVNKVTGFMICSKCGSDTPFVKGTTTCPSCDAIADDIYSKRSTKDLRSNYVIQKIKHRLKYQSESSKFIRILDPSVEILIDEDTIYLHTEIIRAKRKIGAYLRKNEHLRRQIDTPNLINTNKNYYKQHTNGKI